MKPRLGTGRIPFQLGVDASPPLPPPPIVRQPTRVRLASRGQTQGAPITDGITHIRLNNDGQTTAEID